MNSSDKQITSIYDLAKAAGVSHSTVSRVLNGQGRASEETRNKILALAEKANFRPSQRARRTTVALVANSEDHGRLDEYYIHLLLELFKQVSANDLSMEIYSKHNISKLRHAMIDGVLFMPWNNQCCEIVDSVSKSIPKVIPNAYGPSSCSVVMTDHLQSGAMAAEHLIRKGHRKASVIFVNLGTKAVQERLRGFKSAFVEAGLEFSQDLVFDLAVTSLDLAVDKTLSSGATATFLASEGRIAQLAALLRNRGAKIPRDVSVIAMEAYGLNAFQDPPYTSIQQPLDVLASKSVSLLLRKIETGDCAPERILLDNLFIERESVATVASPGFTKLPEQQAAMPKTV